jgi:hypothetical protein
MVSELRMNTGGPLVWSGILIRPLNWRNPAARIGHFTLPPERRHEKCPTTVGVTEKPFIPKSPRR